LGTSFFAVVETRHAFGAIEWQRGSTGFVAESYVESRIDARNRRRSARRPAASESSGPRCAQARGVLSTDWVYTPP